MPSRCGHVEDDTFNSTELRSQLFLSDQWSDLHVTCRSHSAAGAINGRRVGGGGGATLGSGLPGAPIHNSATTAEKPSVN